MNRAFLESQKMPPQADKNSHPTPGRSIFGGYGNMSTIGKKAATTRPGIFRPSENPVGIYAFYDIIP